MTAETEGNKPLLAGSLRIFPGQREVILEDRCGLGEAYAVFTEVRLGLRRVPVDSHVSSVLTIVRRVKQRAGQLGQV